MRLHKRFVLSIGSICVLACLAGTILLLPRLSSHAASPGQSLGDLARAKGLLFGAAVSKYNLQNDSAYRDLVTNQFSVVIAENEAKFPWLHPEQNRYDFTDADYLVNFAQQNGKEFRGHTLIWHQGVPDWLKNGNFSRDEVISIMRDHITTVLNHFKGKVKMWDVVNEATADPNEQTTDPDGLRSDSFWYQKIGPDYIALAFQFAHEADPDVQLFYNDYAGEGLGTKSDRIYNLVNRLRNQGITVNGIGLQTHFISPDSTPSKADIETNMRRLANLGLTIHVTEMDVWTSYISGSRDQKLQQQAQVYGDMLGACLDVSACKLFATWGVSDNYSWVVTYVGLTDDEPLLFDKNYQAKPAYYTLVDILGGNTGGNTGSVTLHPTADRYNIADSSGTEDIIYASTWQTAYIKFSLASAGSTVSHATLRLYHERWNDQGNLVVRAYKVDNDSWSETDNDSLPSYGDEIASTTIANTGWLELDVTNFVAGEKSGDGTVTIAIRADHDLWAPFHSRENTSNQPELVVSSS